MPAPVLDHGTPALHRVLPPDAGQREGSPPAPSPGPGEGISFETDGSGPRVGPNAVLQLIAALRGRGIDPAPMFAAAGLPGLLAEPPSAMMPAAEALALFRAVLAMRPDAGDILSDAGARTGAYVLENRIPRPAQWLLRALPGRLALPLLLRAIAKNAWTFGASRIAVGPGVLVLPDNPMATPGCPWHRATIGTLVRALAHPGAMVDHPECRAKGGAACRFRISRPG